MQLPFVSIIIPVFNDPDRLQICLTALQKQTYPEDLREIIVVDNGSTDNTLKIAQNFPVVTLVENQIQSSYAARNLGIQYAKGEIIAMLDSDCQPIAEWLENGVKSLQQTSSDLIGGRVKFTFSEENTIAEVLDSMSNMQIENDIKIRGVAKTANLFVRKSVFESIGLFPNYVRSGGDVIWTRKAGQAGFKLNYSENAEVLHPARKLMPLLKKQYRVGYGQPQIWSHRGESTFQIWSKILWDFRPPIPKIPGSCNYSNVSEYFTFKKIFLFQWWIQWLCRLATNLGRISYWFNICKNLILFTVGRRV